jgi:hypothetical protein
LIVAAEFIVAVLESTVAGDPAKLGFAVPGGYVPGVTPPRYSIRVGPPDFCGDQPYVDVDGCDAVLSSQLVACDADAPVVAMYSAATPATSGEAMLVPDFDPYVSLGMVDWMLVPGAAMSTTLP